jgi:hypothetical protein
MAIDLDGSEQPIDPMLVKAIETAFLAFSVPTVSFVPVPRAWREANPSGSAKGPSGSVKARIKLDLIERDGFRCAYCARQFVDLNDATLDHVIPNCVVGHWKPWNLVLACDPCNNAKSDGVPLVLMPMLFHLLSVMETVARTKREQKQAAKKDRRRAAKTEGQRRHQFYKAMRALDAPFVRLAIDAAPEHTAFLAEQSEA